MDGKLHFGMESVGKSLGYHFYVFGTLRAVCLMQKFEIIGEYSR